MLAGVFLDAGPGAPAWAQEASPPREAPPPGTITTQPVEGVSPTAESAPQAGPTEEEAFENVLQGIQAAPDVPPEESVLFYDAAYLQGMNKVTARVSPVEAPIGSAVRFGNLEIIARTCWKAPPEERPESAALLEIWNMKPGEQPERIFLGWMFASSPGLSALEHPVYDITVLDCRKKALHPEQ